MWKARPLGTLQDRELRVYRGTSWLPSNGGRFLLAAARLPQHAHLKTTAAVDKGQPPAPGTLVLEATLLQCGVWSEEALGEVFIRSMSPRVRVQVARVGHFLLKMVPGFVGFLEEPGRPPPSDVALWEEEERVESGAGVSAV